MNTFDYAQCSSCTSTGTSALLGSASLTTLRATLSLLKRSTVRRIVSIVERPGMVRTHSTSLNVRPECNQRTKYGECNRTKRMKGAEG